MYFYCKERNMTHETQNVACQHAIAARGALEAFERHQPEADLDWSSFDTGLACLDNAIDELRRLVRGLHPVELPTGGLPAAIACLIEEIQAAGGPDMEFHHDFTRIEYLRNCSRRPSASCESLANACRHSKSKKLFLELTLAGDILHIRFGIGESASTPILQRRTLWTQWDSPSGQVDRGHSDHRQ